MMKELFTKEGVSFFVEEDISESISAFTWKIDKDGYVCRITTVNGRRGVKIYLHRVVAGESMADTIDHIDNNKKNNTRKNLRFATNGMNRIKTRGSSQFKGVTWNKKCGKWQAQIKIHGGKNVYIGLFDDEHVAAHEYNKLAMLNFGEFACINPVGSKAA